RFAADGTTVGDESRLNTETDNDQQAPSVTALSNGGLVVTWQSEHQDGDGWGVYGRTFAPAGIGGDAEGDILTDIEHLIGSAYDDHLTGNDEANQLTGLAGDDTLTGGEGADTLDGGAGADTASYARSDAAVTVNLATGTGTGGDAEGDTLTGIEHLTGSAHGDTLTGDAGANRLDGGAGADTLTGGGGADTLTGGAGADTLRGGTGADLFVFAAFDGDRITDFQDGRDRIDLRGTDATFANLTIADSAADVTVTWDGGTLTLTGVDHALLTEDDFLFGGT
ncbi:MAG: hypothetical protein GDA36_04375, partial [Rhodobacteraceae bacterium]|nr:hypothetical protein [Paracoccaceae bacterium]